MSDLRELYQEVILDHHRRPRNCCKLDCPTRQAEGFNPLCGDRVKVYLIIEAGKVKEATFEGSGCAISTASASMMTEAVKGKTLEEAKQMFANFHHLVTGKPLEEQQKQELGKLEVFSGVCEYPARVKCASLVWHTLNAAIEEKEAPITTE